MCNDNAYIYFSDLVPSQNSYVVTEKPLACSQGTSKYADYPSHSCMPWFIDPSEQSENTQLKKKIPFFFPIITSPSFLMRTQFGKGRGLILKLYLVQVSSWEMRNDGCTPLVHCLMRWTSAGNPDRTQSTWGVMPMRASLPSLSSVIFEQEKDLPICRGILVYDSAFLFPGIKGSFSPSQHSSLFHCSTKLLSCLSWTKSLPFIFITIPSWKHHGAVYRKCVPALGRVRPFQCPK